MSARRFVHNAALLYLLGTLSPSGIARAQEADDHIPPAPPAQPMVEMSDAQMAEVMQMRDDASFAMFKLDQFEHARDGSTAAWEAEAWYGSDFDKLWLRSEGEHASGHSEDGHIDLRTELFWDHAFTSFWDWQLGARHDSGTGPTRDWAAFGVQGLAPYWIELEATAYLGEQGRSAARLRAEYELLFTQKLILQPELELNFYGKSDRQREVGAGLSDAAFGLRLRYEIRREFAPYVGIVWTRRFGDAADFARAAGHDAMDAQVVAGVRVWF
jgi:copper resistance protein B